MTEEEQQALIARWEKVWPPLHQWAYVWNCRVPLGPLGRLRFKNEKGFGYVDVFVSRRAVSLQSENASGLVGKLQLNFATGEVHSVNKPERKADGELSEELKETFRQFALRWTDTFRRDCWLAGFHVVATGTEKGEWLSHGRALGLDEDYLKALGRT